MKLNKPAMLAALSCLALAGYAGAASLSQITSKSVDVQFAYPAIPLQMELTPLTQGPLQPGNLAADTALATAKLNAPLGMNVRLGIRWAQTPEQTITSDDGRFVQISGKYNPVNKLKVRYWFNNAAAVSINGGDKYWTTSGAVNSVTTTIQADNAAAQTIGADRYIMVLEGAVYRS